MTGGDIAGLIAAGVFALLVLLLAVPILKLGRVFDEVRTSIRSISDGATPLMDEVTATVSTTNQQLKKVDGIASNVSDASANISALSSLVAATVGSPLIKVAAFSYGVRSAFAARRKPGSRPPQPLNPFGRDLRSDEKNCLDGDRRGHRSHRLPQDHPGPGRTRPGRPEPRRWRGWPTACTTSPMPSAPECMNAKRTSAPRLASQGPTPSSRR